MKSALTLVSYLLTGAALACAQSSAPSIANTVYLIRHGEKPSNGSDGLSAQGEQRAECLVNVFSASSGYDIGYILAEQSKSSGARERPLETVTPLAESLGLTVDTSCSSGNILICWEHDELTDIAEALGVEDAPDHPDDAFNIIWTLQDQEIVAQTSEDCPGLDD